MTRKARSKENLERKVTELYIRLNKRQTTDVKRKLNIRRKLNIFKKLLDETIKNEQALAEVVESKAPASE